MKATHNPLQQAARHLQFPDTADPALTPGLLLRCAAHYLTAYGRTVGEFFDLLSDQPWPPACATGAINIAAHGKAILCADDQAEDAVTDAAIAAIRVFAASLDVDYANGDTSTSAIDIIAFFNDHPNTTTAQVVQALTDAADDWDRLHPGGAA